MWIFDDDKPMTNKEVLQYAQEGKNEAVRKFPEHVKDNASNMLFLAKHGYDNFALEYASPRLKKDIKFLKKVAEYSHYVFQDDFFKHVDPSMQNNKELLDIFAAKADEQQVKNIEDIRRELTKMSHQDFTPTKKRSL